MAWLLPSERSRHPGEREAEPSLPDSRSDEPPRRAVGRLATWREVLATGWALLAATLAAGAAVALRYRSGGLEPGRLADARWASSVVVLACLLAGVLEGSHRAIARRERKLAEKRRELERLIRTPQRRVVEAKFHLYRDAFMCTQIVGFLMMSRMDASAMTPEAELGIEQSWGNGFLERFRRMFGTGVYGDVVSQRIGGSFPPKREQALAIYVGLADFLRFLAERITERDLDPDYLHGADETPKGDAPRAAVPDPPSP